MSSPIELRIRFRRTGTLNGGACVGLLTRLMTMLKLESVADLNALHADNVKEGLHLEYKASGAIDKKDDTKKLEMARDAQWSKPANCYLGQKPASPTGTRGHAEWMAHTAGAAAHDPAETDTVSVALRR